MHEIEVKILGVDRAMTEAKLISLGARKVFDGLIHALYYDSADRSIGRSKGTFRLRREGELSVLTFKEHVENPDAKVREEEEVQVSDFHTMRTILEAIGFSVWLEMKKHRTSYELNGVRFEFDRHLEAYEYIPEFLEIEGADVASVYNAAEALGFKKQDCRPWDAVQVAQYYASLFKV